MNSLSPRNSGFIQLSNTRSRPDTMPEDIPLSTIKSRASTTGARRSEQVNAVGSESSEDSNSKSGALHGRRKALGPSRTDTGSSEEGSLNVLGRAYAKVIGFNASLRYLIYIVPVGLALAVPLIVLAVTGRKEEIPVGSTTETRDDEEVTIEGPPLFRIFLWIEIAWLTIWAGKLVAFMLPLVFMFVCGVVSSGTRKYATVLRNLTIPLSLFFWALASWISFREQFKRSKNAEITWVRNFERVLGATFASSAVYLGEKAIVQLIGISYHQRSFANRIKASKTEVRLLGLLLDASRALFPMYCQEFEEEDYIINDNIDLRFPVRGKGKKGGSRAVPLRLVNDVGRLGDKVTSVFGGIASEITGKDVFNPNSTHSIVIEALEKTRSSEALGRRIWMSFVLEGRDSLLPEDFAEVLGPQHKDDAETVFDIIDEDGNGDIGLDEMVRKVVSVGKERKAIVEGMKDISQALQAFDKVLQFLVLLIVIFIFLAFFQSTFITTLATAGTALLSLSFVFAATTQEFLGSCIFLFVKHPYDVGDKVDIRIGVDRTTFLVERISLLYTVFIRLSNMQVVQTPNIILNDAWIENVSRSHAMYETVKLNISFDTTFEDIELLRVEMEKFVQHPDNARDFQPDFAIDVSGVGDLDKLQLSIGIMHKSNWHDDAMAAKRRSKFMCALTAAIKRIPIYAPAGGYEELGSLGNPAYNVTVSDQEAAEKRTDADKAKEGLRLVPTGAGPTAPEAPAAPGGEAYSSGDWFDQGDKGAHDTSRMSLESSRTGTGPRRGESKHGLRRAGETLSTSLSHTASVTGLRPSSSIRSPVSRGAYDEEAQMGSPVSPQQGGFLAPSASQRAAAQTQAPGAQDSGHGQTHTHGQPQPQPQTQSQGNPYLSHPIQQAQGHPSVRFQPPPGTGPPPSGGM